MLTDAAARSLLRLAVALSLAAAGIHFVVMPAHYAERWGYGVFFMVAATAQAVLGLVLESLRRWGGRSGEVLPHPLGRAARRGYVVAIAGTLALLALWLVTRTAGVPLVGPEAGKVEAIGVLDVADKLSELGLVAILTTLAVAGRRRNAAGIVPPVAAERRDALTPHVPAADY